jgi:hypothetical protein
MTDFPSVSSSVTSKVLSKAVSRLIPLLYSFRLSEKVYFTVCLPSLFSLASSAVKPKEENSTSTPSMISVPAITN